MSTAAVRREGRLSSTSQSHASEAVSDVSWPQVTEEAVDLLSEYLAYPTVNDPSRLTEEEKQFTPWIAGHEAPAASWLSGVFRSTGISVELLESAPGRVNLIASIEGTGPHDLKPIVLLSHSDVVPAVAHEWTSGIDPFGGAIHDGYIYGRGALDLKGLGIAHLMILKLLKRLKVGLKRKVIVLIVADEEAGGRFGSKWLLERRPELLDCELVLGEGGFSIQDLWHGRGVHAVAVAEKGCLEVECLATAKGHHAGFISQDDAPARLVTALHRVLSKKRRTVMTPPSKALLKGLAAATPGPKKLLLQLPFLSTAITAKHLSHISAVNAMLRDTVALSILESGVKGNVIPGQARAVLSFRLLPGHSTEQVLEELRSEMSGYNVQVEPILGHTKEPNACQFQTPYFSALAQSARSNSDGIVVPILSPAASDCRLWRYAGVKAYGWVPFPTPYGELSGMHGANERVSIRSFEQGIQSLFSAVMQLANIT